MLALCAARCHGLLPALKQGHLGRRVWEQWRNRYSLVRGASGRERRRGLQDCLRLLARGAWNRLKVWQRQATTTQVYKARVAKSLPSPTDIDIHGGLPNTCLREAREGENENFAR